MGANIRQTVYMQALGLGHTDVSAHGTFNLFEGMSRQKHNDMIKASMWRSVR